MLYLANPTGDRSVHAAMRSGLIGFIDTPRQGNIRPEGVTWCADNGCFGKGYPGDNAWIEWLSREAVDAKTCLFATAPDVVGEGRKSLARSLPFLPAIRELGYKAALVGQDGMEGIDLPWDEFDTFFIGGSTEWKLSEAAKQLAKQALSEGKQVHMGRVNSKRRMRLAHSWGCNSVDGTKLCFGPSVSLKLILRWSAELKELEANPPDYLF